jgi:hypothetical protein
MIWYLVPSRLAGWDTLSTYRELWLFLSLHTSATEWYLPKVRNFPILTWLTVRENAFDYQELTFKENNTGYVHTGTYFIGIFPLCLQQWRWRIVDIMVRLGPTILPLLTQITFIVLLIKLTITCSIRLMVHFHFLVCKQNMWPGRNWKTQILTLTPGLA